MIAILLALSLIPQYNLRPWSTQFGLVTATDSIRYTWTMPVASAMGGPLHSDAAPELWCLLQFQPGFPPRWDQRFRVWTGPAVTPGTSMSVTIPVYGYGAVWLEVVGPGGRSPRSNAQPSRLQ